MTQPHSDLDDRLATVTDRLADAADESRHGREDRDSGKVRGEVRRFEVTVAES